MWTRALLKQNAKEAFRRNYWMCVAVSFVTMVLMGGFSVGNSSTFNVSDVNNASGTNTSYNMDSFMEFLEQVPSYFWTIIWAAMAVGLIIGLCVSILFTNLVQVGCNRYFLENREHKTGFGQLFYSFQGGRYGTTVWVMFLKTLYIFGWSLLFIIPGIVKSYSYMLVPYILAENPSLDHSRVFKLSREMMNGHKWEAFVLELSFMGWLLLASFTGGILNIFYVNPYVYATYAEFYSALKAEARMKGILQSDELPTTLLPEVEVE